MRKSYQDGETCGYKVLVLQSRGRIRPKEFLSYRSHTYRPPISQCWSRPLVSPNCIIVSIASSVFRNGSETIGAYSNIVVAQKKGRWVSQLLIKMRWIHRKGKFNHRVRFVHVVNMIVEDVPDRSYPGAVEVHARIHYSERSRLSNFLRCYSPGYRNVKGVSCWQYHRREWQFLTN